MDEEKTRKALNFKHDIEQTIRKPYKPNAVLITFSNAAVKEEFTDFAKAETGDCYWLAIKQLLDFYKDQTAGDAKTIMLLKMIEDLRSEVAILDQKVANIQTTKKGLKTWGKTQPEE